MAIRDGASTPVARYRRRVAESAVGVLAGVGAFIALLAGGLAVVSHLSDSRTPGNISLTDYLAARVGQSRPAVLKKLGNPYPLSQDRGLSWIIADLPPPPRGSACDYYVQADSPLDAAAMQFCYVDDLLVRKSSYGMEGQGAPPVCTWVRNDAAPSCGATPR